MPTHPFRLSAHHHGFSHPLLIAFSLCFVLTTACAEHSAVPSPTPQPNPPQTQEPGAVLPSPEPPPETPEPTTTPEHTTTDQNPDTEHTQNPTEEPIETDENECNSFNMKFQHPQNNAILEHEPDQDIQRAGFQVNVQMDTDIPEGIWVTLHHETLLQSVSAPVTSRTLVFESVELQPGENTLEAFVRIDTCDYSTKNTVFLFNACTNDRDCPETHICNGASRCETKPVCEQALCQQDAQCNRGEFCIEGCCAPLEGHQYILVEDRTEPVGGRAPGADIDAISVRRAHATQEYFATQIEDAHIGVHGNDFTDPSLALGPPDANCTPENFVALGGAAAGGYLTVSFHLPGEPVGLQTGDTLTIYELGHSLCGRYEDDPFRVSISTSTERESFVEQGQSTNNARGIVLGPLP